MSQKRGGLVSLGVLFNDSEDMWQNKWVQIAEIRQYKDYSDILENSIQATLLGALLAGWVEV